jgi:hypothetical protein
MEVVVGRNAPCPCGSGRKFKKCCLAKEAASARPFTAADRQNALARLRRFAHRAEFAHDHEVAEASFWGDGLDRLPDDEVEDLLEDSQGDYAFHMWFFFDFVLEDGRTLAERFLEQEGARLGAGEREYLARMRPTHVRLYEVAEVKREEGLRLVDVWTDERLWVRERAGTRQLVRWDLLAARTMPGAAGDLVMDGPLLLFPATEKEEILAGLRRAHRTYARRVPDADVGSFFKQAGDLFHRLWLDRVALRPAPALVTPEGDPFVFARAAFDVRDPAALRQALASHPDLAQQDDGSYVWLEGAAASRRRSRRSAADPDEVIFETRTQRPGRAARRSLGTFVLKGDRLVFETTSRARADRGRGFLEGLVGSAIRFRATRYQDVEQALAEHRGTPRERAEPDFPPEVVAQLTFDFYDRHYRAWPGVPLPALGGRTPRQAARLASLRPRLVALLKWMENASERARRAGRPAYDFGWLWGELGLERP